MIKMHFQKGGKVVIEPEGYGGDLCRRAVKPFEQLLGSTATTEETAEAQLPAVTTQAPQQQREQA